MKFKIFAIFFLNDNKQLPLWYKVLYIPELLGIFIISLFVCLFEFIYSKIIVKFLINLTF